MQLALTETVRQVLYDVIEFLRADTGNLGDLVELFSHADEIAKAQVHAKRSLRNSKEHLTRCIKTSTRLIRRISQRGHHALLHIEVRGQVVHLVLKTCKFVS